MKKTIAFVSLLLLCSSARAVQYELTLPLQYNYYQPLDAAALGGGHGTILSSGPAALFGNPCRMKTPGTGASAEVSGGFLSDSRSHVLIATRQSLVLPASAVLAWSFGRWGLGLGYAGHMNTEMSFPDQWQPYIQQQAGLTLRQISLGGFYEISREVTAGLALCGGSASITWQRGDTLIAQGPARGLNLNAGIEIAISPDLLLFTRVRTECRLDGTADYLPEAGDNDLTLYGVVPALSSLGFSYRIDTTTVLAGQIDITGWQNASWDYRGRADFKLGVELQPVPGIYALRLGFFTMGTPLVPQLIQNYPGLKDMYFLTAGQSFRMGEVTFSFSAATSRVFSGDGLKQDILAMSLQYSR
ncbi:MAG: hypothetical protein Q7U87_04900 [bacterium]|nr:hypothetical protein [bacterium]